MNNEKQFTNKSEISDNGNDNDSTASHQGLEMKCINLGSDSTLGVFHF